MKGISARKLKNTLKLSKDIIWRSKTTIFDKNVFGENVFLEGLALIWARDGPIWALMGPYRPIWAHMGPYGPIYPKNPKNS